ncbi:MAG: hypothetical protein ACLP0J_28515 [Solirubrobacteraceae bacterium]|jgi:hypothetical protein
MDTRNFRRLGLGVVLAAISAAPAQAATTPVDTSMCTTPALSQPFVSWQDTNWYALAPGESADQFTGAGWVLSGGATIVTTTLADGTTNSVLALPAGSQAVSPTICLTSAYPEARMMVSNVSGNNGGKVGFSVSYAGTTSANEPTQTGTFKTTGNAGVSGDWMLTEPVNLQPSSISGWQPMQITLTPSGSTKADFRIYNLYLDPRMSS